MTKETYTEINDRHHWQNSPERDSVTFKNSEIRARYTNTRLKRKEITDKILRNVLPGPRMNALLQTLWLFDVEVIKARNYPDYFVGREDHFFEALDLCGLQAARAWYVMSVHSDLFPFIVTAREWMKRGFTAADGLTPAAVPTLTQEVPVDNTPLNTIGTLKAAKTKARDSLKKEVARIMGEYRTETGHNITSIQIDMILHSVWGMVDDSLVTGIKITTTASEDI